MLINELQIVNFNTLFMQKMESYFKEIFITARTG